MATDTKTKDLVVQEQVRALRDRGFSPATIAQFAKELAPAARQAVKAVREGRKAKRQRWAEMTKLSGEDRQIVAALPDVLGKSGLSAASEMTEPLKQAQVDSLFSELVTVRRASDLVTGREDGIKDVLRRHAQLCGLDTEGEEPGEMEVVSKRVRHRAIVRYQPEKETQSTVKIIDLDALEGVVGAEVWEAISVPTRTVDQELLLKAILDGRVTPEQFAATVNATEATTLKVTPSQVRVERIAPLAPEER